MSRTPNTTYFWVFHGPDNADMLHKEFRRDLKTGAWQRAGVRARVRIGWARLWHTPGAPPAAELLCEQMCEQGILCFAGFACDPCCLCPRRCVCARAGVCVRACACVKRASHAQSKVCSKLQWKFTFACLLRLFFRALGLWSTGRYRYGCRLRYLRRGARGIRNSCIVRSCRPVLDVQFAVQRLQV